MSPSFEKWLKENLDLNPEDMTDVSQRAAQEILGPDQERRWRFLKECIDNLRRNQLATQVGMAVETTLRPAGSRAALLRSVAKFHSAGMEVLAHVGVCENTPAILSVFRALGYCDSVDIVRGLSALQRGVVRDEEVAPSTALAQALMFEPAKLWTDWVGAFPMGPCNATIQYCNPDTDEGAEFVYRVLAAAGWDITREEVEENLDATLMLLLDWEQGGGE